MNKVKVYQIVKKYHSGVIMVIYESRNREWINNIFRIKYWGQEFTSDADYFTYDIRCVERDDGDGLQ